MGGRSFTQFKLPELLLLPFNFERQKGCIGWERAPGEQEGGGLGGGGRQSHPCWLTSTKFSNCRLHSTVVSSFRISDTSTRLAGLLCVCTLSPATQSRSTLSPYCALSSCENVNFCPAWLLLHADIPVGTPSLYSSWCRLFFLRTVGPQQEKEAGLLRNFCSSTYQGRTKYSLDGASTMLQFASAQWQISYLAEALLGCRTLGYTFDEEHRKE